MTINFDVNESQSVNLTAQDSESVPVRPRINPRCVLSVSEDAPVTMQTHDDRTTLEISESINFGGSSNYEDLTNKPSINDVTLVGNKTATDLGLISEEVDPTVPAWAKQPTKPHYTPLEVGAFPFTDIGDIDLDPYDYDFAEYLNENEIVESGFYKFHDIADDFKYFLRVERTESTVYQEWWSSEEGSLARHSRSGFYDGEEWDFTNEDFPVFSSWLNNYYTKSQTYSKGEVNDKFNNYYTDVQVDDILDNNYYTSDQVDELLEGFAPENMISTTWANLVALRDAGNLVGGAYYRITDYNFITSKVGIQSGNHQFDIVVLAISESMVSETAYAVRHAGDHYFEREITTGGIEWLYTLFVDDYAENYGDEPVDHADDLHGTDVFCDYDYGENPLTGDIVPVLYKTDSSEYDFDDPDYNDCFYYSGTYDFDGDEYDMWAKFEDGEFMQQYALTPVVVVDDELTVSPIPETKTVPVNMNAWELKYCLDNDKELFAWADTNGKGVIYYLKDEFGNEAPYDFKNVLFQRRYISAVSSSTLNAFRTQYLGEQSYSYITTTSAIKYWYTYSNSDGTDGSLFGDATYNIIEPYIVDGTRQLNDIVALSPIQNKFLNGCYTMTMQGTRNTFSGCFNILVTCGTSFFDGVRASTMSGISSCTFNGGYNIRGSGCGTSTFNSCWDIDLGNNLNGSVFGGACNGITIGNYCQKITLGSGCSNLTFGQYCNSVDIGIGCANINLGNYFRYITIGDDCSNVTLNTASGSTSNYVQYITIGRGVKSITMQPTRKQAYEQIYYKTGRTETAV